MPAGEGTEESQELMSESESSEEPNILSLQPRTPKWREKRERKQKAVVEKA